MLADLPLGARSQVSWPSSPSAAVAVSVPAPAARGSFESGWKSAPRAGCHVPPALGAAVAAFRLKGRHRRRAVCRGRRIGRVLRFSRSDEWQADGTDGGQEAPDLKTCMVMAGFSFDAYTLIDRAQGVWTCQGNQDQRGICGVQAVLLSSTFVRDAFRGILRARVLSAQGLRGAGMAGAVAVFFRTTAGESAGGLQGFQRNSVRRGVLNGLAQWLDEDDSVYLYVPKGALADSAADTSEEEPCLHIEVHKRSLLDNSTMGILGTASIPMSQWGSSHLKELCVPLVNTDPADEGEENQPGVVKLQLEFDEFGEVSEVPEMGSGVDEQVDDVTAEARYRRRRFGSNVPTEVRLPETERLNYHQLEAALRRRGLPWQGDSREVLENRLKTSIAAEKAIYDAGSWWNTVENFLGTDRKAQLAGALDVASSAAETLSGDLFGALGAGFMSGANEIAGVGELLKGDFAGAVQKRREVWKETSTEDGRLALQQKADAAVKRAKKQAMIRLAHGMELMSVRRGAWKMLQQAIEDEGAAEGQTASFESYEQLAYLEAPSTNTECWIWRFNASKRIVVTWRGTADFGDVLTDIAAIPRVIPGLGKVHEGFSRAYDSIRAALHAVLARGVRGDGHGWEIIFTGHSLGGALATLSSVDVAQTIRGLPASFGLKEEVGQVDKLCPLRGCEIVNVTFGAPRVGSARFCTACDEFVPRTWRVFSTSDVVPTVPPKYLWGFLHAGIGVELDPEKNTLTVRGRTADLKEALAEEEEEDKARLEREAAGEEPEGSSLMLAFQGDVWASFNGDELSELRRVLGTGSQAVGEHMEDNYFARITECISESVRAT